MFNYQLNILLHMFVNINMQKYAKICNMQNM